MGVDLNKLNSEVKPGKGVDLSKLHSELNYDSEKEQKYISPEYSPNEGKHNIDVSEYSPYMRAGVFDNPALEETRAQGQSNLERVTNAIPRLISKVGTEIAKTPAYLYAVGEAGLTDKNLAETLDNAWLNTLENLDSATKEKFAVYTPKSVKDGNLWDNLTSTSFWTTEGVDGAGFLIAMMAPGAALKSLGLAGKVARLGVSANFAKNVEIGTATLINTTVEAAAETKGLVDSVKPQLIQKVNKGEINEKTGKPWTEEDVKETLGEIGQSAFLSNMALIAGPNFLMNKNLLGRFTPTKNTINNIVDEAGQFKKIDPLTKKQMLGEFSKELGKGLFSEGFVEEAGQFAIEDYHKKLALGETDDDLISGLLDSYGDALTTTEGQKSIFLGGLFGSVTAVGGVKQLNQEKKYESNLSKVLKDNFEGFSTSLDNLYQRNNNGEIILDENNEPILNYKKASEAVVNIALENKSSKIKDVYALAGNKEAYDYIANNEFTRFALPYLQEEGGLELLDKHIDLLSKKMVEQKKAVEGVDDTMSEMQYVAQLKQKAKQLQKTYNSVDSLVDGFNLNVKPENQQKAGEFLNKLKNAAYQETAKQFYLSDRIDALTNEMNQLSLGTASSLPQVQADIQKISKQVENHKKALNESIENYKTIFDTKEQNAAFKEYLKEDSKVEEVINKTKEEVVKKEEAQQQAEQQVQVPEVIEPTFEDRLNELDLSEESDLLSLDSNLSQEELDAQTNAIKDKYEQERQALKLRKEQSEFSKLIDKATNPKELDSIVDQIDSKNLMSQELIDKIAIKRDSLKGSTVVSVEKENILDESEKANNTVAKINPLFDLQGREAQMWQKTNAGEDNDKKPAEQRYFNFLRKNEIKAGSRLQVITRKNNKELFDKLFDEDAKNYEEKTGQDTIYLVFTDSFNTPTYARQDGTILDSGSEQNLIYATLYTEIGIDNSGIKDKEIAKKELSELREQLLATNKPVSLAITSKSNGVLIREKNEKGKRKFNPVKGYITNDIKSETLLELPTIVVDGFTELSNGQKATARKLYAKDSTTGEFIDLMARNLTNDEALLVTVLIAQKMGIVPKTVENPGNELDKLVHFGVPKEGPNEYTLGIKDNVLYVGEKAFTKDQLGSEEAQTYLENFLLNIKYVNANAELMRDPSAEFEEPILNKETGDVEFKNWNSYQEYLLSDEAGRTPLFGTDVPAIGKPRVRNYYVTFDSNIISEDIKVTPSEIKEDNTPFESTEIKLSNIEAKKADIERRRQEEKRLSNKQLISSVGEINTGNIEIADLPTGIIDKTIANDDKGNPIKVHINYDNLNEVLLSRNGKVLFRAVQGRFFIIAKVGDFYLPFYISSAGTSGKNAGEWYPFFGYNNWLVKGSVGKKGEMEYTQKVDEITNLLNENLQIPAKYFTQFGQITNGKGTPVNPDKVFYDINNDLAYESWFVEFDRKNSPYTEEQFVADRTGLNPKGVKNDGKGSADAWIRDVLALIENAPLASKGKINARYDVELTALTQPIAPVSDIERKRPIILKAISDGAEVNITLSDGSIYNVNTTLRAYDKTSGTINAYQENKQVEIPLDNIIKVVGQNDNKVYYDAKLITLENNEPEVKDGKKVFKKSGSNRKINLDRLKTVLRSQGTELTKEEKDWFKSQFPNVPVEDVKGLIDNNSFGRFVSSGKVLLSDLAPNNTLRHEAFHVVTQLYLTPKEIKDIYSETRNRMKNKDLSDLEVEEILAEDFANYKDTGSILGGRKLTESIFDKILNFIKKLIGLSNTEIRDIYNKLETGQFLGKQIVGNNQFRTLDKSLPGKTEDFTKNTLDGVDYEFFSILFENGFTPEKLFQVSSLSEKVYDIVRDAFIDKLEEARNSENKIAEENFEYILENWDKVLELHNARLKSLGISLTKGENEKTGDVEPGTELAEDANIVTEESVVEDENKDTRGGEAYKNANSISTKDLMFKQTKLFIRTLPKVDENGEPILNDIGLPSLVDFNSTYNFLLKELAGKSEFPAMVEKIKELSKKRPEFNILLERLGVSSDTLSFDQILFQNQFRQDFDKNQAISYKTILKADGTIYTIDATRENTAGKIKEIWKNKLPLSEGISLNGEGRLITTADYLKSENNIEFLSKIGITFSKETLPALEDNKAFSDAVLGIKKTIINSKYDLTDLFNEKSDAKGNINTLLDLEAKYTPDVTELSFISTEGKTVYSISLNNALSVIKNIINNAKTKEELFAKLPHLNSVNTKNSLWLKSMFDADGNKRKNVNINLDLLDGLATQDVEDKAQKQTTKLSKGDKLVQELNNLLLDGKTSYIRASDKSTEHALTLSNYGRGEKLAVPIGDLKDGVNSNKLKDIFRGYFKDELQTIFELAINNLGADIDIYRGIVEWNKDDTNVKIKWRLFSGFPDSDGFKNKVKAKIEELKSSDLTAAEKQSQIDDLYNELVPEIDNSVVKFFDKYTKELTTLYNEEGINETNKLGISKELAEKYSFQQMMRTLAVNDFINTTEQIKLFVGDMGFYKDLFKRTSGATGTKKTARVDSDMNSWLNINTKRKDGKQADGKINVLVFQDSKQKSDYFNSYVDSLLASGIDQEQAKSILSAYQSMDEADAQGYITLDEYREFFIRTGDWKAEHQRIFEKSQKGETLTGDEIFYFMPIKAQYFGPQDYKGLFAPAYHKYSLMPLIPKMIEGTNLEKLLENMTKKENQIGYALFKSGSKVGTKVDSNGEANRFYTNVNSGEINSENLLKQVVDYKFLGIQLDIAPKLKKEVIFGTQFRKLLFSNLFENSNELMPGAKDLFNEYSSIFKDLIATEKSKLIKELGINPETYKQEDVKKLVELLRESSRDRNLSDNVIDALQTEEVEGKIMLKYNFDLMVNKSKIDSMIMSLVNSRLIRQMMNGDAMIQGASTGFEKAGKRHKGSNELKFYREGTDGKTLPMEVKVPLTGEYRKLLDEYKTIDEVNKALKSGKIDKKTITLIGYRIPTQGLNSIEFMEIQEFLPESAGNLIILPTEIVAKSGGDYDIDKMNIFRPWLNPGKNDVKIKQNRIIDIAKEILEQEFNFNALITPNSTAILVDVVDQVRYIEYVNDKIRLNEKLKSEGKKEESIQSFDEYTKGKEERLKKINYTDQLKLTTKVDQFAKFLGGKAGVGIGALQNTHHILSQIANLHLNKYYVTDDLVKKPVRIFFKHNKTENGNVDLSKLKDVAGKNNISEVISQVINASVDIAKDPFMFDLNMNLDTLSTYLYLVRTGVEFEQIAYFMKQPIITEYLNELNKNKSVFLKATGKAKSSSEIVKEIEDKYLNLLQEKLNIKSKEDFDVYMSDIKDRYDITTSELKSYLSKSNQDSVAYLHAQIQLLQNYIDYKEQAGLLSEAINSVNHDTAGLGSNLDASRNKIQQKEKVEKTKFLLNNNNIYSNTFVGGFDQHQFTIDAYSQFYSTQKAEIVENNRNLLSNLTSKFTKEIDKNKVATLIENDFINYVVQNYGYKENVNSLINRLFKGDDSLSRKLLKLKTLDNPTPEESKLKDNVLIKELYPLLANKDHDTDNIRIYSKRFDTFTSNQLSAAFREIQDLDASLAKDLMDFAILQSGLNNSAITFMGVVPFEYYGDIVKSAFDEFDKKNGAEELYKFNQLFIRNNSKNPVFFKKAKKMELSKISLGNGMYGKLYSSNLYDENAQTIGLTKKEHFTEFVGEFIDLTPTLKTSLGKELEYKDPYVPQSRLKSFKQYEVLNESGDNIGTVVVEYRGNETVILHPKLNVTGKGYGKDLYKLISSKFNVEVQEWNEGAIANSDSAKKMWDSLEKEGSAKRIIDAEQGDNFRVLNYRRVGSKQDIQGFKEFIQNKPNSVKSGVSELFESNPELANSVYEALGFNNDNIELKPYATDVWGKVPQQRGDNSFVSKEQYSIKLGEDKGIDIRLTIYFDDINKTAFVSNIENFENDRIHPLKKGLGLKGFLKANQLIISRGYTPVVDNLVSGYGYDMLLKLEKSGYLTKVLDKKVVDSQYDNIKYEKSPFIFTNKIYEHGLTIKQKQQAQQVYSQYLDTIFPDSQVKDIVYHGTNINFDKFDKDRIGSNTAVKGEKPSFSFSNNRKQAEAYSSEITVGQNTNELAGVWFEENQHIFKNGDITTGVIDENNVIEHYKKELGDSKEMISPTKEIDPVTNKYKLVPVNNKTLKQLAEIKTKEWQQEYDTLLTVGPRVMSVIIDVKNPKIVDFKGEKKSIKFKEEQKNTTGDAFIAKNIDDWGKGDVIQVFEPEQIHILGSKEDIEGFKKFVENNKSETPIEFDESTEIEDYSPEILDNSENNKKDYSEDLDKSKESGNFVGKIIPLENNFDRESVKNDSDYIYLFTDNAKRTSGKNSLNNNSWYALKYRGVNPLNYPTMTQAVIRGLDNAFPITTMVDDNRTQWNDNQFEEYKKIIDDEINTIKQAQDKFKGIKFAAQMPFGQGKISNMKQSAPKIWAYLNKKLSEIGIDNSGNKPTIINTSENFNNKKTINIYAGTGENADLSNFAGVKIIGKLKMMPDNIIKIKSGKKTITNRTEKFEDGYYELPDNTVIYLELIGTTKKSGITNLDEFAKKEGFENWNDFEKNNKFSKKFVEGTERRYVYSIKLPIGNSSVKLNPKNFINYSGAAIGGDTVWANIGKEFGIGKQVDYRPEDLNRLNSEQLKEVEDAYQKAVKDLGRNPLSASTFAGGLVRRDYLQAKAADSIFAISSIVESGAKDKKGYTNKTNKQVVEGGTGYAVQMAINLNKPVFVFDQNKNQWFKWENNKFTKTEIPTLTTKFAGIGTREINEEGKQAIRDVYEKTFNKPETLDWKKEPDMVPADSLSEFKKAVGLRKSQVDFDNRYSILRKTKAFNKEFGSNYSVSFKKVGESNLFTYEIAGGPKIVEDVQTELDFDAPVELTLTSAEYNKIVNDIETSNLSQEEKQSLLKELSEARNDEEIGSVIKKFCK